METVVIMACVWFAMVVFALALVTAASRHDLASDGERSAADSAAARDELQERRRRLNTMPPMAATPPPSTNPATAAPAKTWD